MLFLLKGVEPNKPIKKYPIVKIILLVITIETLSDIYSISFIYWLIVYTYKYIQLKDCFDEYNFVQKQD